MLDALKRRVKALLASARRRRRAAELEQSAPHVTREQLAADLKRLGVQAGDVLFVHSSLKSLGFVEGGPAAVLGALQDAVGPQGTLLLPTYYLPGGTILATCEMADYVFDPRRHGSNMGALPAAFLQLPGVRRSVHPTHSVSAVGALAQHLTEAHHQAPSVFGTGSPWQRFAELPNGKVIGLGISMGPVTFYHLAEDTLGDRFPLPVWQQRVYPMPCKDFDGRDWTVPVRAFDPEIARRRIDQKPRDDLRAYFAREFEAAGLKHNGRVGEAQAWWIPGPGFLAHLLKLADEDITIYATAEQLAARPVAGHRAG